MAKKKNLLFVFADQWRRHAMGFAGEDPVITPNMDAFAAKSVYCTDAVSTCPLCSPHRASLMTGLHPRATGVFTNCKNDLDARLRDEDVCISDVLHDAGYATGYIGKWHLDEPDMNNSEHPVSGAEGWDAFTPPGPRRHHFDFWYSYGAYNDHQHPHYWKDTPEMIQVNQWSPEHETDVAIKYLENADKDKPFSLFISWNPPHSPYDLAPQKYYDLYKDKELPFRANVSLDNVHHHTYEPAGYNEEEMRQVTLGYYASVSGLDDQFGRLLEALERLDLMKDTIVVLSADHGDMMGSHALMAKHVWYEESIGIPLVVGGADLPEGRCGTVIGSPDFAPTLLGMLDLDVPACMTGEDRAKDIYTCTTDADKAAYLCCCPGRDIFLDAFRAEGKDPTDYGWRGVRTRKYTYVVEVGYETTVNLRRYLYDLEADPMQMHPLMLERPEDHPEAARLEEMLKQWLREEKDGFLAHISDGE